ncbi:MAG: UDP-N-acetylmuramoyl-L-alanyl-D-glutamate--2,6-diaminopimelate ligase [Clostridia bacterium]|nr:UDP-N-acetylmuramoyl-L-alanyl-D-glutamate--2,6-diaminopimelate ligase [Clostridia bacterium]
MKLGEILRDIDFKSGAYDSTLLVNDVVYDSRKASENTVFVCIKGFQVDGHSFAQDAYRRGTRIFAVEHDITLPSDAIIIKVENTRRLLALASANLFGRPAEKLNIIAITGTKGKTSTSFMLKSIYEAAGHKVGVIGSTGVYIGEERFDIDNSTPESYLLHKFFRMMLDAGCDTAVIEATSQGFKLDRTYGIRFRTGIFTNLSPDHIGAAEHSDFAEYLACKKMIFDQSDKMVVNLDSDHYAEITKSANCDIFTFGKTGADYCFENPRFTTGSNRLKTVFTACDHGEKHEIDLNTPGYFSLYNATSAIAAARLDGIGFDAIKTGLSSAFVKGRMEIVPVDKDYTVIIDFAHNEFSVKNLFDTMRLYSPKRIISVFGCGGNRSKLRRYSMGEVIGRSSDLSVITSDNSRYENVEDIIADILVGMKKTDGKYVVIPDRRKAIKAALEEAKEGDVVLLIGKGHEMYEEINGEKLPFDERQVVREALGIN